ncbi:MAG: outer membrane beta-barrel protein [Proteobacteria bacterium]|nr:outer membrane beta-barrel protein [Pseudomonadota bacterium]
MNIKRKKNTKGFDITKKSCTLFFLAIVIFAFTIPVYAAAPEGMMDPDSIPGNIKLGALKIHPYVYVDQTWTDNVFQRNNMWGPTVYNGKGYTSSGNRSDTVNTVTPGIRLFLPFGTHLFHLNYNAALKTYNVFDQFNNQDQLLHAAVGFNFGSGLNVLLRNDFIKAANPPRAIYLMTDDYTLNTTGIEASYKLADRYKVKAFYEYETKGYSPSQTSAQWDDYKQNKPGVALYYRFLPLTSALLEFSYQQRDYSRPSYVTTNVNSEVYNLWTGLAWEPAARIKGTFKIGYTEARFKGGSVPNWNGIGFMGNVNYAFTERTTVIFNAFRGPIATSYTAFNSAYGDYYVSTSASLAVNHQLPSNFVAKANISYTNNSYAQYGTYVANRTNGQSIVKQSVNIPAFGLGLDYVIRKGMSLGIHYDYSLYDSNIDIEGWKENRIGLLLSIVL